MSILVSCLSLSISLLSLWFGGVGWWWLQLPQLLDIISKSKLRLLQKVLELPCWTNCISNVFEIECSRMWKVIFGIYPLNPIDDFPIETSIFRGFSSHVWLPPSGIRTWLGQNMPVCSAKNWLTLLERHFQIRRVRRSVFRLTGLEVLNMSSSGWRIWATVCHGLSMVCQPALSELGTVLCLTLMMVSQFSILCGHCFQTKPHDAAWHVFTSVSNDVPWYSNMCQAPQLPTGPTVCAPFASTVELSCIAGSCFQLVSTCGIKGHNNGILVCLNY